MKINKQKKPLNEKQKRSVWTFFTLLFPSLVMALLITFPRDSTSVVIGVLMFFYQSILLKDFIEKHYNASI
jgi:polyferredoxin